MPCHGANIESHRALIYQHLQQRVLTKLPGVHIFGGDWNATMFDTDRSSGNTYPRDVQYRNFMSGIRTHTIIELNRNHSYFSKSDMLSSRIDDIHLMIPTAHAATTCTLVVHTCVVTETMLQSTDHKPVKLEIPTNIVGLTRPPDTRMQDVHLPPKTVLIRPVSKCDRERFRMATMLPGSDLHQRIQALHTYLTHLHTADVLPFFNSIKNTDACQQSRLNMLTSHSTNEPTPAATVVEDLAANLQAILEQCHDVALQTCATVRTNPSRRHHKPRGLHKKFSKLYNIASALCVVRQSLITHPDGASMGTVKQEMQAKKYSPHVVAHVIACIEARTNTGHNLHDAIHICAREAALSLRAKNKEISQKRCLKTQAQMRRMLDQKPKQAHRIILGKGSTPADGPPLSALKHPDTGEVSMQPKEILNILQVFYGQLMQPPGGRKNSGKYLPQEQDRHYPWQNPKNPDNFVLETKATSLHQRPWLHDSALDVHAFEECVQSLSNGKCPGPDGITNELLKMLPTQLKECTHMLLVILWATGYTPTNWKSSDTVLLYKKNNATDPKNYRPIGLANTLYKLWTRFMTCILYEYAEKYNILSSAQAGFRKFQNTSRQLQMLTMMLEDAKITEQDIYLMLIDFTSAFNTINQDKLLCIMYDLGFPTDAIDSVRSVYQGATTKINTQHGTTSPIQVERGTIQGDTLSPFIFLIFIEPLLRWLQVGGRGYMFGCIKDEPTRVINSIGSLAFADDVAAATNTVSDLKIQADKASAFSDWGSMETNAAKTLVTGALYGSSRTGLYGNNNATPKDILRARLEGQIMLQGRPAQFHDPTEPMTYLGVDFTMTIDWKPQLQKIMAMLQDVTARVFKSPASPRQVLKIVETCIKPKIAYSFCVAPYSPLELDMMDVVLRRLIRQAYKLPKGTPSAMLHADKESFGIGCGSVQVLYNYTNVTQLLHSLNDPGRLGLFDNKAHDGHANQTYAGTTGM